MVMELVYLQEINQDLWQHGFVGKDSTVSWGCLDMEELFQGTIDAASVYPREVVRHVLNKGAAAVILCHNHPSGSTQASQADIQIIRRLQSALELIDVRVLDHLIVAGSHVVSFTEQGLM